MFDEERMQEKGQINFIRTSLMSRSNKEIDSN